jgi:hypothetical protein
MCTASPTRPSGKDQDRVFTLGERAAPGTASQQRDTNIEQAPMAGYQQSAKQKPVLSIFGKAEALRPHHDAIGAPHQTAMKTDLVSR